MEPRDKIIFHRASIREELDSFRSDIHQRVDTLYRPPHKLRVLDAQTDRLLVAKLHAAGAAFAQSIIDAGLAVHHANGSDVTYALGDTTTASNASITVDAHLNP